MKKITMSEEELNAKVEFLSSAKCNHTFHKYIDIAGDLVSGTLLSQILYWFSYGYEKKSKARIYKDGYYWIAKQRKDWWEEIRITERQYDKAIKNLVERGFIVLGKYKFNSLPIIHLRPNYARINECINEWEEQLKKELSNEYEIEENNHQNSDTELQEAQNGNYTLCNSQLTQSVKPLTYTTNNDYINNNYGFPSGDEKQVSKYGFFDKKQKNFSEDDKIINPEIDDIINNIAMGLYPSKYELGLHNTLIDILHEFDNQYYNNYGKKQRLMMHKSYATIVNTYFNPPNCIGDCNFEDYKKLIEIYFKTEYNGHGKYKGEIKKSAAHFFNRTILENLYYTYQINMMKGWE